MSMLKGDLKSRVMRSLYMYTRKGLGPRAPPPLVRDNEEKEDNVTGRFDDRGSMIFLNLCYRRSKELVSYMTLEKFIIDGLQICIVSIRGNLKVRKYRECA